MRWWAVAAMPGVLGWGLRAAVSTHLRNQRSRGSPILPRLPSPTRSHHWDLSALRRPERSCTVSRARRCWTAVGPPTQRFPARSAWSALGASGACGPCPALMISLPAIPSATQRGPRLNCAPSCPHVWSPRWTGPLLRREPGSVVDPELRESGERSPSSPPAFPRAAVAALSATGTSVRPWTAWMALRMLVTWCVSWSTGAAAPGSPVLPVIIPLVMYHGPEGAGGCRAGSKSSSTYPGRGRRAGAVAGTGAALRVPAR